MLLAIIYLFAAFGAACLIGILVFLWVLSEPDDFASKKRPIDHHPV